MGDGSKDGAVTVRGFAWVMMIILFYSQLLLVQFMVSSGGVKETATGLDLI